MNEYLPTVLTKPWGKVKEIIRQAGKAAQKVKLPRWWVEITDAEEDKNFLITKFEGKNLRVDHEALRKVFIRDELKKKKFAIISIAGKMRTGKSFLLNYILRYLRYRGWENPNWMGDGDRAVEADGITFKGGKGCCTTGIRIFGEIFEVPVAKEETLMVMLMDTQGLFDHNSEEVVNKTLLTLTTFMSSVQIFNSEKSIDTQSMDYLKTCVEFALETTKASETNPGDGYIKLQNLMFLVRDYPESDVDILKDKTESYGSEVGNKYLKEILELNTGGDEQKEIRSRIKDSFDNVACFAMPHPGMKAIKANFQARNKDLEEDFLIYVQKFVEHVVSPQNLLAKRSSTQKAITPREMMNMIAACDNVFAKKMDNAPNMIKMNQIGHFSALREEAVKQYDDLMKMNVSEDDKIGQLRKKHEEFKKIAIQKLDEAALPGADDFKKQCIDCFSTMCDDHFEHTEQEYNIRLEKKYLEDEETQTAIKKYKLLMERSLPDPVTDDALEKLHLKHQEDICIAYTNSVDMNTLKDRVKEIYETIKKNNKDARETAEKERIERQEDENRRQIEEKKKIIERASNKAANMWGMFLRKCRSDTAMKRKKEQISDIVCEAFLTSESGASPGRVELLAALNERYEVAEAQNQRSLKKKQEKNERIAQAIEMYESLMKGELSEPVSESQFEELHKKQKNCSRAAYYDITDDEALNLGIEKRRRVIEQENTRGRKKIERQRAERQKSEERRHTEEKKKSIEKASEKAAELWKEFLETCRSDSAMEEKRVKISDIISSTFLDSLKSGAKPTSKELIAAMNDRYEEAQLQNKLNWKKKRERDESIQVGIENFQLKMQLQLSRPVSDEEFDKLHKKHQSEIFEVFGEPADFNILQSRLCEVYNDLNRKNKDARKAAEREQIEQQKEKERRDEDEKKKIMKRASSSAENMWETFLATYRDDSDIDMKNNKIADVICEAFLNAPESASTPKKEELLRVLNERHKEAKRENELNWKSAMKFADNRVKKAILKIKMMFDEIMVDQYIENDAITEQFDNILKYSKYICKSERLQKYGEEKFKEECKAAMIEIQKKNEKNKPYLPVMLLKNLWRRLMELFFSSSEKSCFENELNFLDLPEDN